MGNIIGRAVGTPGTHSPRESIAEAAQEVEEDEDEEGSSEADDEELEEEDADLAEDLSVLGQLGKGAAAKVFLVRHQPTEQLYAIKVLSKRMMHRKKKGVAHVMKELEILSTCSHPFVISLEASFQTREWLCHLIEYCSGGNFYRLCQRQPEKRLPPPL